MEEEAAPAIGDGFGYPTAIQGRDGRLRVSYTYSVKGGKAIKHAAFASEWIAEGSSK